MEQEKQEKAFPALHLNAHQGMSLRDYFAAKAMQSVITRLERKPLCDVNEQYTFNKVAEKSYRYADEMLKQREL